MNKVIEVNHLYKKYGKFKAVNDVSLEVREGEIFGLLGPNGAGKTTIVECLQGLRNPDSGSIRVLGFNPQTEKPALRRYIGSQLQESALPDRLRTWEALDLFRSFVPEGQDWQTLMEQWGLSSKRKAAFSSLSGGQKQRLFIALALVNNPKLVFLDEMTTGLDPAARRGAWELIRQIRDKGTTVVLVTHFMEEAQQLCDRLAIIDQGRVIDTNSPQGLINKYAQQIKIIFSHQNGDLRWLETIKLVRSVKRSGQRVEVTGEGAVLPHVAAALLEHNIVPEDLHIEQPSLEEVFLNITGSSLANRDLR
jgi:ABC-2 type transport system ATP-binding protein